MVLETIGLVAVAYWGGMGLVKGATQFARGAVLAIGSVAEGNVQGAGYCLARGLLAPGLETLAEGVAFLGDCQVAADAIGRSVASIAPPRVRQPVSVNSV
jgi:hypothetical protein